MLLYVQSGQHCILYLQPLIPVATVLEGALLGAVDTGYIAKRTGLGIAIALAVIYGAHIAMDCLFADSWRKCYITSVKLQDLGATTELRPSLLGAVTTCECCVRPCRQPERAAHGVAGHLGGAGQFPVQQHDMRYIAADVPRVTAACCNRAWHFRPASQWR